MSPNPRIFPDAVTNVALVGATVFPAGVGSRTGLAVMHEMGDSRLAQTILSDSGSIQIVSLRDAIGRMGGDLDLLKLDCEGAEWDIFQDAEPFRRVRLIRMEYHLTDGRSLDDLTRLCLEAGILHRAIRTQSGFWHCLAFSNRRLRSLSVLVPMSRVPDQCYRHGVSADRTDIGDAGKASCLPTAPDEILVHVDGDQTQCEAAIRRAFPEIKVLHSKESVGPGGGRNKLVAEAKHEFVASFDDDSFPIDVDYFARGVTLFERVPWLRFFPLRFITEATSLLPDSRTAMWMSDFVGCGCVYRRTAFLATSGYVPLAVAYGMEEVDLALRLHAQGGKILRTSWLRVFHDTDLRRHANREVTAGSIANLALLGLPALSAIALDRRSWPVLQSYRVADSQQALARGPLLACA